MKAGRVTGRQRAGRSALADPKSKEEEINQPLAEKELLARFIRVGRRYDSWERAKNLPPNPHQLYGSHCPTMPLLAAQHCPRAGELPWCLYTGLLSPRPLLQLHKHSVSTNAVALMFPAAKNSH